MDYVIVAFRSRAHTVRFYEELKAKGLYSEIVNTPKEAGVGCGLSVKIRKEQFHAVKEMVKLTGLSSFSGFFLVGVIAGRRYVRAI